MVQMLEKVGNETSIPLLEKLMETTDLGQIAVKAIRAIRARIVS